MTDKNSVVEKAVCLGYTKDNHEGGRMKWPCLRKAN